MSLGDKIKGVALGAAKVAGTVVLGAVGVVSTAVEDMAAATDHEVISGMGHDIRSASFNGVRRMWGKEEKEYEYKTGESTLRKMEEVRHIQERQLKEQQQVLRAQENEIIDIKEAGYKTVPREEYTSKDARRDIAQNQIKKEDVEKALKENREKQEKIGEMLEKNKIQAQTYQERRELIVEKQHDASREVIVDKKAKAQFEGSEKSMKQKYTDAPKVKGQMGNNGVAFVFSCPGQCEQMSGYVCAGTTGKSLGDLIERLHQERGDIFCSPNRNGYTITNASDRVHYQSLTGDTEASSEEILLSENLSRLRDEVQGNRYIICMGSKAALAVDNIATSARIVYSEHLSNMHLNRKYSSEEETPEARRLERIGKVAQNIVEQL